MFFYLRSRRRFLSRKFTRFVNSGLRPRVERALNRDSTPRQEIREGRLSRGTEEKFNRENGLARVSHQNSMNPAFEMTREIRPF